MPEFSQGQHLAGYISEFDEHVGLGSITIDSGEILPFHCINIADGTRTIKLNESVEFEVYYHPRGRFEARNIVNRN